MEAQKEKQIFVSMLTTVLVTIFYALHVYKNSVIPNPEILNDLKFWGVKLIWFIPISVVAQIVVTIVFAIINKIVTNEEMPSKTDERDKIIELKSIRVSHWIFISGFFTAMVFMALGFNISAMFIILLLSGLFSSIVSDIVKIVWYRRGF